MTALGRLIGAAVGGGLRVVSRDVTGTDAGRSCLVLAPHPDDEVLGCAATVMRKRDAGTDVWVMIATDGRLSDPGLDPAVVAATRQAELAEAGQILGVPQSAVTHLPFEDGALEASEDLVAAITAELQRRGPQQVLVTSPSDAHPDHAALGAAAEIAAARHVAEGAELELLAFPVWQWEYWQTWAGTVLLARRPRRVSTRGYRQRKGQAIRVYRSQLRPAAGGTNPNGLTPAFVRRFLGSGEVFFPLPVPTVDAMGTVRRAQGVGPRLLALLRRAKRTPAGG